MRRAAATAGGDQPGDEQADEAPTGQVDRPTAVLCPPATNKWEPMLWVRELSCAAVPLGLVFFFSGDELTMIDEN